VWHCLQKMNSYSILSHRHSRVGYVFYGHLFIIRLYLLRYVFSLFYLKCNLPVSFVKCPSRGVPIFHDTGATQVFICCYEIFSAVHLYTAVSPAECKVCGISACACDASVCTQHHVSASCVSLGVISFIASYLLLALIHWIGLTQACTYTVH